MAIQNNSETLKKLMTACGLSGALAAGYLLLPFEGQVNSTYLDPAKILTSCVGHTGQELQMGQTFTDEQCLEQLAKDITKHDKELMGVVKVKLNPYEHAAYLSFVYNVGIDAFSKSTMLGQLNAGNRQASCDQLLRWTYAGKKQLQGLVRRRDAERDMCLGKIVPDKKLLDEIK